jgi:hypothetical protein
MIATEGKGLGRQAKSWYHVREFDTLDEYLDHCQRVADRDGTSHGSRSHHGGFQLSESFDEAWTQAYDGWVTVRPQVEESLEAIRERLQDIVTPMQVRVHDMIGFEPDIDRYVAGEVECMWDELVVETPHAGKVFTLVLDNCISASQDADEMLKRGATVVALVEAFQMFGFELEIWCETTVGTWGKHKSGADQFHTTLVRVARAGERPDINAIMFPLANPDWQRRLMFGSQEGESAQMRRDFGFMPRGSYGMARNGVHFGERLNASLEISLEAPDGRMVKDPVAWIVDQLRTQGVVGDDV